MEQKTLFEIKALYRDDFRITGFTFGEGEPSICIVGSMRGNENQQLYACSRLVSRLTDLEKQGRIMPGKQILVIPCANPYSMNIKKDSGASITPILTECFQAIPKEKQLSGLLPESSIL